MPRAPPPRHPVLRLALSRPAASLHPQPATPPRRPAAPPRAPAQHAIDSPLLRAVSPGLAPAPLLAAHDDDAGVGFGSRKSHHPACLGASPACWMRRASRFDML